MLRCSKHQISRTPGTLKPATILRSRFTLQRVADKYKAAGFLLGSCYGSLIAFDLKSEAVVDCTNLSSPVGFGSSFGVSDFFLDFDGESMELAFRQSLGGSLSVGKACIGDLFLYRLDVGQLRRVRARSPLTRQRNPRPLPAPWLITCVV